MLKTSTTPSITNFFDVFNELFETSNVNNCINKCPIHDVIEDDEKFTIELILAGVKKEDVAIDVEKNRLSIKAERKENNDLKYNRKESYFGKYEKSFVMPDFIDKENIDASFANGILKVVVPKIIDGEKVSKKMIEIK